MHHTHTKMSKLQRLAIFYRRERNEFEDLKRFLFTQPQEVEVIDLTLKISYDTQEKEKAHGY